MIKAFTGKTGSLKTYLMIKDAYHEWLRGRNIYSNTILFFENFKRKKLFGKRQYGNITYFEEIEEILDIKDGLVIFDEAQVLFNARQWESLPAEFQYKLQQHRKHNVDLICTTQNMGTIDITYRRLVHRWIHCENIFQLGHSPRLFFGIFRENEKDVDRLYNSVDDLIVPTIHTKLHFINYFSKRLYDTMYDIGFRRFKIVWINQYDQKLNKEQMYLIIPKKKSLNDALKDIRLFQSLLKPNKSPSLRKN